MQQVTYPMTIARFSRANGEHIELDTKLYIPADRYKVIWLQ